MRTQLRLWLLPCEVWLLQLVNLSSAARSCSFLLKTSCASWLKCYSCHSGSIIALVLKLGFDVCLCASTLLQSLPWPFKFLLLQRCLDFSLIHKANAWFPHRISRFCWRLASVNWCFLGSNSNKENALRALLLELRSFAVWSCRLA